MENALFESVSTIYYLVVCGMLKVVDVKGRLLLLFRNFSEQRKIVVIVDEINVHSTY